ncbi:MAG: type IV secretion system protein VirB10 [Burkholderiales bacterium]|nr:type IV secretion system protein VirB10 [Burkholderiales bacterium]
MSHGYTGPAGADGADGPDNQPPNGPPLSAHLRAGNVAAPRTLRVSKKGLLAVGLLVSSLVVVSATGIQRLLASGKKTPSEGSRLMRDRPAAASVEPRTLEMPVPPAPSSAASTAAARVPALTPTDDDLVAPIGVHRTGATAPTPKGGPTISPEDAPALLVSSQTKPVGGATTGHSPNPQAARGEDVEQALGPNDPLAATSRNLQNYQRQLQGLLENLTQAADSTTGGTPAPFAPPPTLASTGTAGAIVATPGGIFGGQLQGSVTPKVDAGRPGNRSLLLAKGTAFTCALKTRVISATSGLVGCQVQRNVYSDDGRVLLIERGSHLDGEYRIASVRPGTVRIPVLWTRIRTPLGVTVDLESPATGKLGESGIDGYVDNRWRERIGAALLLSLIDDAVKIAVHDQGNARQGDTIVLPSTTDNASKLAEKVLDSTINIPPLLYQNQGAIVGIYVARDVDFSSVYELVPANGRDARP